MPSPVKTERVTALKERIEGADALLLAEYRGLSVHDATELRRSLAEQARFSVVKNTLFQRAAGAAGIEDMESLLSGPTAVAFVKGDVVAAAKKVVEAAKKYPALVLKGAYMDGKVLDAATAQALATLESREVMLSKVAGMLKSEMSRAASMFQTLQGRFLGVLEAYKGKVPPAEAEPVAEAEVPAEAEATVETAEEAAAPEAQAPAEPEASAEPAAEGEAEAGSEAEPEAEAEPAAEETPGTDETPEADASAENEEE
ncbi:MAG TPA: 50S ribosomal protein L10 [Actinomycetota bacterium]|nr:50S ribosomal protein L10 [Actinomycetota bacterium]